MVLILFESSRGSEDHWLAQAELSKQSTNRPGGTQPWRILKASAEVCSIELGTTTAMLPVTYTIKT